MSLNPLRHLNNGLQRSHLRMSNRIQVISTHNALVLVDTHADNFTLTVSYINDTYSVGAIVSDDTSSTTYPIAEKSTAADAAQALRDAATNHIGLAPFQAIMLALAELLARNA